MTLTTVSAGERSQLTLNRADLLAHGKDLEALDLPIATAPTKEPTGTTVALSLMRPKFEQPSPKKLSALLLREFGFKDDFAIFIDGEHLTPDALDGKRVQLELALPDDRKAEVTFWFLSKEREVADTGISLRVDDRLVGPPSYFGLEQDEGVPRAALRRMYVEVRADDLREHVTADWTGIVENSEPYQDLQRMVAAEVKDQLLAHLEGEAPETEAQFMDRYEKQLELLPLARRDRVRRALLGIFKKLFGESPERKHVIADLVMNCFEEDRYWKVARRLDEIGPGDLSKLADLLQDWGLGEVAEIATRAKRRLRFLDSFQVLATADETLELSEIHKALEHGTWILGEEYELRVSNKTLRDTVQRYTGAVYRESNGRKRPDLLMFGQRDEILLVELKRPKHEITYDDASQAREYRDSLNAYFPNKKFRTLLLGGSATPHMARDDGSIKVSTYTEVIAEARARLKWLLDNLDAEVLADVQERQTGLAI
jgi:hypothetical protein